MKSIQRSLKNTRAEAAFIKMANCILLALTVVFFRLKGLQIIHAYSLSSCLACSDFQTVSFVDFRNLFHDPSICAVMFRKGFLPSGAVVKLNLRSLTLVSVTAG